MEFQRGDVVLIPFPYTDFSAAKTRPAVVISSELYHSLSQELLLAYVSSQVSQANPAIDHVLMDWKIAGLLKPSFVRPKIAACDPALVVHRVGRISNRDMQEVDRRLYRALGLAGTALESILTEVDWTDCPASTIQALAEKSVAVAIELAKTGNPDIFLDRLQALLSGNQT
jgi:mRNA interferase MazF